VTRYKDRNGAGWLIVMGSAGRYFGTPDPEAAVHYDPEPPDTDVVAAEGAVAALIEKWAAANKSAVVLEVKAAPSGLAWLVLLVLVVAASEG
jgi:hypothetical protein